MNQDPPRLTSRDDMPEELRAALRALRDEYTDAARLTRVEKQLEAQLARTASSSPQVTQLRRVLEQGARGVPGSLTTRLVMTGLLVGTGALWWAHSAHKEAREAARPVSSEARRWEGGSDTPDRASSIKDRAELNAAPREPHVAEPQPHERSETDTAQPAQRPERPPQPTSGAVRPSKRNVNGHTPAAAEHGAGLVAGASDHVDARPPQAEVDARPPRVEAEATPEARTADPASSPRTEVDLLLEARRLKARDPQAALALLDEHERRFEAGVLAPEREVLAIEVLRALGQLQAAEERRQRFRARYPDSVHTRRLEQR